MCTRYTLEVIKKSGVLLYNFKKNETIFKGQSHRRGFYWMIYKKNALNAGLKAYISVQAVIFTEIYLYGGSFR